MDNDGINLALFHGSESGWCQALNDGKIPHAPFQARQIRESGLHHAFVGHFHTPRDAEFHTYPGNPEPLSFGESDRAGAVIASVGPDGTVTRERHSVAVTTVHDLEVDISGAESADEICERVADCINGLHGAARVTIRGSIRGPRRFQPRRS